MKASWKTGQQQQQQEAKNETTLIFVVVLISSLIKLARKNTCSLSTMDVPDRYPFLALPLGNKREQAFEKYFPILEEYNNRYGHTNVPQHGPARDILERHCPGFVTYQ